MQEARSRRSSLLFSDGFPDGLFVSRSRDELGITVSSALHSLPSSSESSSSSSSSSGSPTKHIEHRVSKMDTLVGVAIKYGVEVADIKRLNGLVTDLQMFAYKSLQIPLPGRHPPSPCMLNDSVDEREQSPSDRSRGDFFDSLALLKAKPPPTKVSVTLSGVHGYYGLIPPKKVIFTEGTEMAVYRTCSQCLGDQFLPKESPTSEPHPTGHRKTRSLFSGFSTGNGENIDENLMSNVIDNNDMDIAIRRRQKFDGNPALRTPELLLKENNSNGFPGRIGIGLALRPKSGSRTDMDMGSANAVPSGDSFMGNNFVSVRKSCSTSSLQDSENCSSIWPTSKRVFKPDALSKPIFDGLPKPSTVRRNKAALD